MEEVNKVVDCETFLEQSGVCELAETCPKIVSGLKKKQRNINEILLTLKYLKWFLGRKRQEFYKLAWLLLVFEEIILISWTMFWCFSLQE